MLRLLVSQKIDLFVPRIIIFDLCQTALCTLFVWQFIAMKGFVSVNYLSSCGLPCGGK